MSSFKPLNAQTIHEYIGEELIDIHTFASLDSTNTFLKTLPYSSVPQLCVAETQTQGRGRFGREWVSPFGENIYLSIRWPLTTPLSKLSGLSLVVSLAIHASLAALGITDLAVKWPNDLLWQGKKLAGILIEIQAEAHDLQQVIIGIGINVNSNEQSLITQNPSCSLYQITGRYLDRNQLIATMFKSVQYYLNKFLQDGFSVFQNQWQQVDYLINKHITLSHLNQVIIGYAQGVTDSGNLVIVDNQGVTLEFTSGDTSLRSSQANLD